MEITEKGHRLYHKLLHFLADHGASREFNYYFDKGNLLEYVQRRINEHAEDKLIQGAFEWILTPNPKRWSELDKKWKRTQGNILY